MKSRFLLLPLLLAPALGACTDMDSGDAHVNGSLHLSFGGSGLNLKAPGRPDAHVTATGDLRIGDSGVAVTPAQRDLLKRYYGEAMSVRDDGIATGKAGAEMGMHAVGNVLASLFADNRGKSDPDMDASSEKIDAAAQKLCTDLLHVQATQGELAAQLPAFKAYAVFRGEVQCDRGDSVAERDRIRDKIRGTVRGAVQAATKP